jgi:ABC-type polysaccharide/polyol phosphate export permease
VGVNFPVEALPVILQKIAYCLPLTRGIMASRLVLNGSGWSAISSLFVGEIVVGLLYIMIGYLVFHLIEKRSLVSGTLDAM